MTQFRSRYSLNGRELEELWAKKVMRITLNITYDIVLGVRDLLMKHK